MIQQATNRDVGAWRPQRFGTANVRKIRDPLIEPVWIGQRVLVHFTADEIEIVDEAGVTVSEDADPIVAGIRVAAHAESLVIDGYLTRQATAEQSGARLGQVETLSPGELTAQMLLGRRTHQKEIAREAMAIAAAEALASPLAFVAVDLLAIDGTPLLDVPLLERKRILESAIEPGELVRIGPYVRAPIDAWIGTWRALGFISLAYKAANGRYAPGAASDGWALARIPKQ